MVTKSKAPVVSLDKAPLPVSLAKSPQVPAAERLAQVLKALDKSTAKDLTGVTILWGRAIALQGGGSVYINRSNADVRATQKQVADWAKAGLGTVRGAQGQYLRIAF